MFFLRRDSRIHLAFSVQEKLVLLSKAFMIQTATLKSILVHAVHEECFMDTIIIPTSVLNLDSVVVAETGSDTMNNN